MYIESKRFFVFFMAIITTVFFLPAVIHAVGDDATIEAEIPPFKWGEPGLRECMIETAPRWNRRNIYVSPKISTHGPRVPAFPGAEGFGAYSFGGRGGKVYRVTNLNDSGPGSLREAVTAREPRIVIFDVSGTIHLESRITIVHPYLYIAGQTAPGGGITVTGRKFIVQAHDSIVRHMRFRRGVWGDDDTDEWSFRVSNAAHVIADSLTVTWGCDGNLGVTRMDYATIQNSVMAKPLWNSIHPKGTRGYGALVRGRHGARYSFLGNLWANHRSRVPRPGNYISHEDDPNGLLMDFRNNVVYQGIGTNYDADSITVYNFVNNYYLTDWRLIDRSTHTKGFLAGNYRGGEKPDDQWGALVDAGDRVNRENHQQNEPFESGTVTTLTPEEAWEKVTANAGAWIRDEHDKFVVQEVKNYYQENIKGGDPAHDLPDWWRSGRIDCQSEVGGLPNLESVTIPEWVDNNRNGIPDWWEQAHGLDSDDPGIASIDSNGNGYTNIEDYINDLDAISITHKLAAEQITVEEALSLWKNRLP